MSLLEIVLLVVASVSAIALVGLLPCLVMVAVQYVSRMFKHTIDLRENDLHVLPSGRWAKVQPTDYSNIKLGVP